MCRSIAEHGGRRCTETHTTAQHSAYLARRRAVYAAGVAAHADPVFTPDPIYDKARPGGDTAAIYDDDPDTWEEMADVDAPLSANVHAGDSPLGQRLNAVARQWARTGFDGATASGLTLRDHGTGTGSLAPLYGFEDQDGREWVAIQNVNTTAEWSVSEVSGRYEAGLAEVVEEFTHWERLERQYHRGPTSVTSPGTDAVRAGLGERWTPAFMETSTYRPSEEEDGELGGPVLEYLTVFASTGEKLASKEMVGVPTDLAAESAVLRTASQAGWLTALAADVHDATTIHTGAARIPVAVKDAVAYAEWLGDHNPTTVPVQEWLSAGGLKAEAATAAIARQLTGPAERTS